MSLRIEGIYNNGKKNCSADLTVLHIFSRKGWCLIIAKLWSAALWGWEKIVVQIAFNIFFEIFKFEASHNDMWGIAVGLEFENFTKNLIEIDWTPIFSQPLCAALFGMFVNSMEVYLGEGSAGDC